MYCATHDAISGSPPQVRGKLSLLSVLLLMMRITPAGAGKTNINRAARHNAEDHPRGCGENLFIVISADKFMGSPPRMRGKPRVLVRAVGQRGITPADAGKTI